MKVFLFDADGVLTLPEELFAVMYARSRGLDPEPIQQFFKNEWNQIVTGKQDLKESIESNPEIWQWSGTTDELLEYWFKTEDVQNNDLLEIIRTLREDGAHCYLATDQEKYRGDYMKNVMFKDLFDEFFISSDIGLKKSNPQFFTKVLETLRETHPSLEMGDITFFDDSQVKVDSAIEAGVNGVVFQGNEQVRELLKKSTK